MAKDQLVQVRCDGPTKARWMLAAMASGLSLTNWFRRCLDEASVMEEHDEGLRVLSSPVAELAAEKADTLEDRMERVDCVVPTAVVVQAVVAEVEDEPPRQVAGSWVPGPLGPSGPWVSEVTDLPPSVSVTWEPDPITTNPLQGVRWGPDPKPCEGPEFDFVPGEWPDVEPEEMPDLMSPDVVVEVPLAVPEIDLCDKCARLGRAACLECSRALRETEQ